MSQSKETNESPVRRREVLAWAFYDFANSGYTTVVLTTVYSAYFVAVIAAELDEHASGTATLLWTLAVGVANFLVLLAGPVIGAIADIRATKKSFLLATTLLCVGATALLGWAGPGQYAMATALVVLATVAFALGENLIAAFLPEIARPESMGRVSGLGWCIGYFGGLFTLACCLIVITRCRAQGLDASAYVPATLLITALIFAVTATPTFVFLRERARARAAPVHCSYAALGFQRVRATLSQASLRPDLFRFLMCLVLFQSGVATVVVVAAIYAQEVVGFDREQLIVLIMVVNLTAALGAFGFGFAQDRFGSVPSLAAALLLWIVAIGITWAADSQAELWLAGNLIGIAMGSTQAGGRAVIGRFTPATRNGEFFGLWGLAGRAAAIIGPLSYGAVSRLSGGDYQLALLTTLGFFVTGLLSLCFVNERRGCDAASESLPAPDTAG